MATRSKAPAKSARSVGVAKSWSRPEVADARKKRFIFEVAGFEPGTPPTLLRKVFPGITDSRIIALRGQVAKLGSLDYEGKTIKLISVNGEPVKG